MRYIRFGSVALAVFAATVAAQPQFRVQTNVIEVDVRVTDARGDFAYGLAASDFEVLDNGRERPIVSADLVDRRAQANTAAFAQSDVSTNEAAEQRGRLYLLVLDDLLTHPLRSDTVKAAARLFVQQSLGPGDRAAVVVTSGRQGPSQEFTEHRERLLDAINRFQGQRLPRTTVPTYASPGATGQPDKGRVATALDRPQPQSPAYDEEGFDALTMLARVEGWARWLSGLTTSRKALVLVSEGIPFDTTDVFVRVNALLVENAIRDTIAAASRNNVAVYAIDPRGLPTGRQTSVPTTLVPDEEYFSMETMRAKMTLRALAGATGGFAFTNSNDFGGAFNRIVRESSTYYLLGFYPEKIDQRVHDITVRVKRPGLKVRFRPTYVAAQPAQPSKSLDARLSNVIGRPLPTGGIAMRMTAAPFRIEKNQTVMLTTVEVPTPNAGASRELAFRVAAVSKDGRVSAVQSFAVTPQGTGPVRAVCELPLRPGEYQIRVAAILPTTDAEGSVYREVVVPNLAPKPLSVAGPFLASSIREWTAFSPSDLKVRLRVPPTANRTFATTDELTALAFVYADAHRTSGLTVTAEILDDTGKVSLTERRALETASPGEFIWPIPLGSLTPNNYTLRIEMSGATAQTSPVMQQVGFSIHR